MLQFCGVILSVAALQAERRISHPILPRDLTRLKCLGFWITPLCIRLCVSVVK
jgi:hypothetical protein